MPLGDRGVGTGVDIGQGGNSVGVFGRACGCEAVCGDGGIDGEAEGSCAGACSGGDDGAACGMPC